MAPLIVILISPFALHEPLSKRKLPFVAMAFIGIVLVSGVLGGETGNFSGVIMGLLAAAAFVVIVICNRKIHDIPSLDKSIIQLAVSALTILPYVLVKNHDASLHLDTRSLLIILMLGVIHTGFAYILYFSAMHNLPVTTFAVIGYLEPVVSVLCSAFFLHEAMGPAGWIGAILIIGAAIACELGGDREEQLDETR
jgi:drug/metabolite transporter (DMT)-like permease